MTLFHNGKVFRVVIQVKPPSGYHVPIVEVEMAGPTLQFQPVIGKVDTGAFRTMLNAATARLLGIDDISKNAIHSGVAKSATGHDIRYYVHPVQVRLSDATGQRFGFRLQTAFSNDIRNNLFGVDWLRHLCVAIDSSSVFFLAD